MGWLILIGIVIALPFYGLEQILKFFDNYPWVPPVYLTVYIVLRYFPQLPPRVQRGTTSIYDESNKAKDYIIAFVPLLLALLLLAGFYYITYMFPFNR